MSRDKFWWILGHHAESDTWTPLYNFHPDKRHIARGMLGHLLNAEPGSNLYQEHEEFDDFRLQAPDEDANGD